MVFKAGGKLTQQRLQNHEAFQQMQKVPTGWEPVLRMEMTRSGWKGRQEPIPKRS